MQATRAMKLWCLSVGISPTIFTEPRVKFALDDSDPVDTLRAIQRCHTSYPSGDGGPFVLGPREQLEFLQLMRGSDAN